MSASVRHFKIGQSMPDYNSVLIVDDDPIQIAILTAYFSGLNLKTILGAKNSVAALEILANHPDNIDLIVSDIQMPGMDGIEFMRYLKAIKYTGGLAIISGVKANLLDHAARLATLHELRLIGSISKPLNKSNLDKLFLQSPTPSVDVLPAIQPKFTGSDFVSAMQNGSIAPYYQPKIDVVSGRAIGAEALARWLSPEYGIISPDKFIPFAEENGFIEELTFVIFEKVLSDIGALVRIDPNLKIAFNLSPRLINNVRLPEQIFSRLNSWNVESKSVSFEITENSILDLDPATLEVLSRLRIYDFDVAIDDFGTGSANIHTLKDFPYSELKIDKSFISTMTTDRFSNETVVAAIALARERDMQIVAEGVEDRNTWDIIREMGIEYAQGFHFAKPMTTGKFRNYLINQKNSLDISAA